MPVLTVPIQSSNDDAEQTIATGQMILNGLNLNARNATYVGLRFINTGEDIPHGSRVDLLKLHLRFATTFEQMDWYFVVEDRVNPPEFSATANDIGSRSFMPQYVTWQGVSEVQDYVTSPDFSALLQPYIDAYGWQSGHAIVIVIVGQNTGNGRFRSFDAGQPASLELEWSSANPSPTVMLNTPDGAVLMTPVLQFAGFDEEPIRFHIQISDNPLFRSGENLCDNFVATDGVGGLAIHANPEARLNWLGNYQVDDRPGQRFTGFGGTLSKLALYLSAHEMYPQDTVGVVYVRIYEANGDFPANAAAPENTPTPGWLAVSDPIPVVGSEFQSGWRTITFSGENQIHLEAGKDYFLILDWVPVDTQYTNSIVAYGDSLNNGTGHPGHIYLDGAQPATNGPTNGMHKEWDLFFEVHEVGFLLEGVSGTTPGFSGSSGKTDFFSAGEVVSFSVQTPLKPGIIYYWRVRGTDPDGSGIYGEWSEVRFFTVGGQEQTIVSIQERGAGSDSHGPISMTLSLSDAGVGAEGSGADASTMIAESGSYSLEALEAAVELLLGDTGHIAERPGNILSELNVTDRGGIADNNAVTVEVLISDVGNGLDPISAVYDIVKRVTDGGLVSELIRAFAQTHVTDTGAAVDIAIHFDSVARIATIKFTISQRAVRFGMRSRSMNFKHGSRAMKFSME